MTRRLIAAPLLTLLAAASTATAQDAPRPPLSGRLVADTVVSAALEGNLLGDPSLQPVAVYLPPGYDDTADRFPSVYLLPPFDGSPATWTRAWPGLFGPVAGIVYMDRAMTDGAIPPMIVVMPNGRNRRHGSFFFNSPVSGGWEDFLANEVVGHVDQGYRTIPEAGSRGVAGHSMGGNAAVHLAMRRPDLFGAVYALSPCCLGTYNLFGQEAWERLLGHDGVEGVEDAYRRGDFPAMALLAMASALTPNPDRPPFLVDLPYEPGPDGPRPVEPVRKAWEDATALARVGAHADELRGLRGIRVDHGARELPTLMEGIRRFSAALADRAIPHGYEIYEGDHHDRIMERLATGVLPFFAETLAGKPLGAPDPP
jgi:S-formylglutathione hydrolase